MILFSCLLIVGKKEVLAVAQEDLSDAGTMDRIENKSIMFFAPLRRLLAVEPAMRSLTLQAKRQKNAELTSPSVSRSQSQSQLTTTVSRRVTSTSSMSDPSQDSAGGIRILSVKEKTVDTFANQFLDYVVTGLWPGGIVLDWVRGREKKTTLTWTDG